MWAFLSRRFWLWVALSVGAPLVSWLIGKASERLESRNGPTRVSDTLKKAGGVVGRQARGPLSRGRSAARH
ncbi:hypothetical protein E1263_22165 [Kribbella antibiotica]|uniref:Uncharacterized protein n=1 Tax=Kribbella antibiotica TaxID=190195 RepID=A0A4R4ZLN8_9ACTN|nr:hypothetical protein [Kribbella antibiotica]TDD57742.1 hypothetical protein E1263_22165 [Kribbella antibiotica]